VADDYAGERSEAATPRRRSEARERGQVARSADLGAAALLLIAMWLLNACGPGLLDRLMGLQGQWLGRLAHPRLDQGIVQSMVWEVMVSYALALAPLLLGLLLAGVAVQILQVGFLFTTVPLSPEWNRVNPIAGFGRLFSASAVMRLLMNCLKLLAIGWVAWETVMGQLPGMEGMSSRSAAAILAMTGGMVTLLGIRIGLVLLFLGILDYGWQRFDYERGLRMTKQELKEEMRRMEGDPQLKARRLQLARQLLRQRMLKQVPQADVVITNPTELAVAIRYGEDLAGPMVIAKGARLMAQKIRELASENAVPIVEKKPLAQALFKNVEIGEYVPKEYWDALFEVLNYVYLLDRERAASRWGIHQAGV